MNDAVGKAKKSTRGFAGMSPEKRREIASKGGKSVPKAKRSFSVNRQLASDAGRKGGIAVDSDKRAYSKDRELAAKAGRAGGRAAGKAHATKQAET